MAFFVSDDIEHFVDSSGNLSTEVGLFGKMGGGGGGIRLWPELLERLEFVMMLVLIMLTMDGYSIMVTRFFFGRTFHFVCQCLEDAIE